MGVFRRVLEEFECGGALTGDDIGVVIRRDDGEMAFLGDACSDLLAELGVAVVEDDFRAGEIGEVRGGCAAFDFRGIGRHDDDGGEVEESPGEGDGLCVVAGGVGEDAADRLIGGLFFECEHGVVGAAELECPDALEIFALQEGAGAEECIEGARGVDGGAVCDPMQA